MLHIRILFCVIQIATFPVSLLIMTTRARRSIDLLASMSFNALIEIDKGFSEYDIERSGCFLRSADGKMGCSGINCMFKINRPNIKCIIYSDSMIFQFFRALMWNKMTKRIYISSNIIVWSVLNIHHGLRVRAMFFGQQTLAHHLLSTCITSSHWKNVSLE